MAGYSTVVNKTRGRPSRPSDAKERILRCAKARFAEDGYARTSLRAIARDADVDHSLVSYYYGSKEGLFKAVTELVLSPAQVFDAVTEHVPEHLIGRLGLEAAITAWDHPDYQQGLSQLIADAMASPDGMRTFREYLQTEMVARIAQVIGGADASKRATPAASIIAGLFFTRYILKLESVASMSPRDVVSYHTPAMNAAIRSAHLPPRPTARLG